MNFTIVFIVFVGMVAGCTSREAPTVTINRMTTQKCVTQADRDRLAEFIINCAEAANPKSDEEGEDLVIQCERTGRNTLCPEVELCNYVTDSGRFLKSISSTGYGACK